MVNGKHMPDCGLTRNETNEYKHEKPNGVSNSFYWIFCDRWPVTCNLWTVTCDLCPVTCDPYPVTCDLRFVPVLPQGHPSLWKSVDLPLVTENCLQECNNSITIIAIFVLSLCDVRMATCVDQVFQGWWIQREKIYCWVSHNMKDRLLKPICVSVHIL